MPGDLGGARLSLPERLLQALQRPCRTCRRRRGDRDPRSAESSPSKGCRPSGVPSRRIANTTPADLRAYRTVRLFWRWRDPLPFTRYRFGVAGRSQVAVDREIETAALSQVLWVLERRRFRFRAACESRKRLHSDQAPFRIQFSCAKPFGLLRYGCSCHFTRPGAKLRFGAESGDNRTGEIK